MSQVRLFLIHAPGCHVCEGAEVAVQAFARANPAVSVFKVDITKILWPPHARFEPQRTPTYVLHVPGKVVAAHSGQISQGRTESRAAIERWAQSKLLPAGPASEAVLDVQPRRDPRLLPAKLAGE